MLVSDLAERGSVHWLKVDLVGAAAGRDGLGAKVVVRAGSLTQSQVHDGKSGYLSQSDVPLYFGLGAAAVVESVTVTWPGGQEQVVAGPIDANQTLVVRQPPN